MNKALIAMILMMLLIKNSNGWRGGYSDKYLPNNKIFKTTEIECPEIEIRTIKCHTKSMDFKLVDDTNAIQTLYALWNGKLKSYKYAKSSNFNLELYTGEFNNDGIQDFAVVRNGGGNGLGSEECDVLFMVSSANAYAFALMPSYGFDKRNFIQVDGKKRVMQTLFTQIDSNSYWIHRYLVIGPFGAEKDKMMPDEWIQYTDKPNHSVSKSIPQKIIEEFSHTLPGAYKLEP